MEGGGQPVPPPPYTRPVPGCVEGGGQPVPPPYTRPVPGGGSAGAELLVVWSFSCRCLPFLCVLAVGGLGLRIRRWSEACSSEAVASCKV